MHYGTLFLNKNKIKQTSWEELPHNTLSYATMSTISTRENIHILVRDKLVN